MGLFGSRWVAVRTEGGSRVDIIDRLEANLKSNGLKTKITQESNSLRRLHVHKKDAEKAKELIAAFDEEH